MSELLDIADAPSTAVDVPGAKGGRRRTLGGPFHLLWGGQSLSLLGDQITLIALPLVAVESVHAGAFSVGALGACLRLPFLVLGLPAGVWVTRAGLVRSMLAADILRGLSVAILPLLVVAGARSMGILFAGALAIGVGTVFFQVAYQSAVPELVDDESRWHPANTRLSLSESTALFAGPALAGIIVAALTPTGALGIDALSYAASVTALLTISAIRRSTRARTPSADIRRGRGTLRTEIGAGIRYVRRNAVLNAIMWAGACYNLGSSMYDTLIVIFAVQYLHMSPTQLGAVIGLGSIGFPIGSALSKYANTRLGLGRSLIWSAFPSVGGMPVAALAGGSHPWIPLAAGTLAIGLGMGCFAVNAITLRQLNSTPEMRAQATSVHRFLSWGALPVGALIAGVLGQTLGLRTAMLASGIVAGLCFIPLFRSPLRHRSTSLA